jgi:hypothetical protein
VLQRSSSEGPGLPLHPCRAFLRAERARQGLYTQLTNLFGLGCLLSPREQLVLFCFHPLSSLGPGSVLWAGWEEGPVHLTLVSSSYIPAVVDHRGGMPCMGTFLLHQV